MAQARVYQQVASEPRCLVCSSSAREEMERLLGMLGEDDPILGKVTLAGITALYEKMDGRQCSTSSIKRHRKHVREVEAGADGEVPAPEWEEEDSELGALIA